MTVNNESIIVLLYHQTFNLTAMADKQVCCGPIRCEEALRMRGMGMMSWAHLPL
jgi:hypothetical protein